MTEYVHELEMKVRDYEIDVEGIVNNANYQHYLEHARHEFLASTGSSFSEMTRQGYSPVVSNINISYKIPLRSGDLFVCKLYLRRNGVKFIFYQDIYKKATGELCVKAIVETVCVYQGKLNRGDVFAELFKEYLQ